MLPLVFTVLKIGGENELVKRLAEKKKEKKRSHTASVPGVIYSFMAALHRHFQAHKACMAPYWYMVWLILNL